MKKAVVLEISKQGFVFTFSVSVLIYASPKRNFPRAGKIPFHLFPIMGGSYFFKSVFSCQTLTYSTSNFAGKSDASGSPAPELTSQLMFK